MTDMGPKPTTVPGDDSALLTVDHLEVGYRTRHGIVQAVSDVSFDVGAGEALGMVGESGSGKSTIARAVMRLVPQATGTIQFDGRDLLRLGHRELRRVRPELQMVFQDPLASLNPRLQVRDIVAEGLRVWPDRVHEDVSRDIQRAMMSVGLDPAKVGSRRASQFSGGQCQRIAIARALALRPKMLVCDEPVSALDVSVQAQILNLLRQTKARYDLTLLFISHDLSVIKNISDRVLVLYLGKVCEVATTDALFSGPAHPYTQLLLDSVPHGGQTQPAATSRTPATELPSALAPPSGCRFRTRCPLATSRCAEEEPPLRLLDGGRQVACHFAEDAQRLYKDANLTPA